MDETEGKADFGDFSGRTVLVTGAAAGIGRAIAEGFAEKGARVALADRDEKVAGVAAGLGKAHLAQVVDVTDEAGVEAMTGSGIGNERDLTLSAMVKTTL